jgi:hypothetical protein
MANTLEHFIREVWAPEVQDNATKKLVAMDICEVIELADGDTYNNPYASDPTTGTYTRNPASAGVSASSIASTNEQLTIGTARYSSFFVDALDEKQMKYRLDGRLKERATYQLRDLIDQAILAEYANAGSTVDEGKIGGTSGVPIGLTSTNVMDTILAGKAELANKDEDVDDGNVYVVMHPTDYIKTLQKYLTSTGYRIGDQTIENGYKGEVNGVQIYTSRNLTQSVVSSYATRHWLMGKKGAISFGKNTGSLVNLEVIKNPSLSDGTHALGTKYILWDLYGKKTFTEGARALVDIAVRI